MNGEQIVFLIVLGSMLIGALLISFTEQIVKMVKAQRIEKEAMRELIAWQRERIDHHENVIRFYQNEAEIQ